MNKEIVMEVISLEEGKVQILESTVIKKSKKEEVEFLKLARELINNKVIKIDSKEYNFKVPEVYSYENGFIEMERLFGENLELILRDKNNHKQGVVFLNNLLKFFLDNKIYWQDFAPRNILISNNQISIMDFERGIFNKFDNLSDYFANTVYEEYGAFLFSDERIISVDDALKIKENKIIKIDEIKSNRVKHILKVLGFNETCMLRDYYNAVKIIITNEEPYLKEDEFIFPLIELEEYLSKKGYEDYSRKVVNDYNAKQKKI